jgi:hypothetical protein
MDQVPPNIDIFNFDLLDLKDVFIAIDIRYNTVLELKAFLKTTHDLYFSNYLANRFSGNELGINHRNIINLEITSLFVPKVKTHAAFFN